jgi:GTPase Era involved in 16S rRNA processing
MPLLEKDYQLLLQKHKQHVILGIVNGEDFQMILSDTPGIIKPAYEMQNR